MQRINWNEPVDAASSVFFRVALGALLAHWAWDYLRTDRVGTMYVTPDFHFTYYLFDWVQPWEGNGMYLHFVMMCMLAIAIGIGCLYRLAACLFALGFIYVFLLDRANYQNHYYLVALISACLPFLPLHRYLSVDAWRNGWGEEWTTPAWALYLIRFHIALPYVFGGLAKLDSDWLLGVPMQQMLESKREMPIIGSLISGPGMGMAFAWSGLLFDLLIVPALLWKPTRAIAFTMAVIFHLMNAALFDIHIFPWMMLVCSTIFFEPDWPRRLILPSVNQRTSAELRREVWFRPLSGVGQTLIIVYCLFHCVWPFRHFAYPDNASWTERGHHFAWRMMLRGKKVVLGYAIRDLVTGQVSNGDARKFLNAEQAEKFGKDPEMILHMAHFLAADYKRKTGHDAAIHALVFASLNGRKPELLIDPNVDLALQPRGIHQRKWLMPQKEPLLNPPWDVPPEKWREFIEMPKLEFMNSPSS